MSDDYYLKQVNSIGRCKFYHQSDSVDQKTKNCVHVCEARAVAYWGPIKDLFGTYTLDCEYNCAKRFLPVVIPEWLFREVVQNV